MGAGPRRSQAETVEVNRAVISQEVDKLMYLKKPALPLRVRYIETPGYVRRPISTNVLNREIKELKVCPCTFNNTRRKSLCERTRLPTALFHFQHLATQNDPKLYKDDDEETIFKPKRRPLSANVTGGAYPPFQTNALPSQLYEGVKVGLGQKHTGWLHHFEQTRLLQHGSLVPWMADHAAQPMPRPAPRPVSRPPSRPGTANAATRRSAEPLNRFIPPKPAQQHLCRLVSEGSTPWRSPPVRHTNGSMRSRPATASSFRSSPSPFPNQQNARQVLKRSGSAPPTRTHSSAFGESHGKLSPAALLL